MSSERGAFSWPATRPEPHGLFCQAEISAPARFATIARELMPSQRQFDESLPVGTFGCRGALHRGLGLVLWVVGRTHAANFSRPIRTSAWQFRPYDCGGRKSGSSRNPTRCYRNGIAKRAVLADTRRPAATESIGPVSLFCVLGPASLSDPSSCSDPSPVVTDFVRLATRCCRTG